MKRILDMIFYIAVIIMMVTGAYCGIIDLFMIDHSTIPKWVDVTAEISGLSSLSYIALWYYWGKKNTETQQSSKGNPALRKEVDHEIKTVIIPELQKLGFDGKYPHYKRINENGKVDYLSFQFNRYGGSFIIEIAVAYPYKGKKGNFYYNGEVTPEIVQSSNYGYTSNRLRIEPHKGEWFVYDKNNYRQVVESALKLIMKNMAYFDRKHLFR